MEHPPIPDKRYFPIGEASELCGLEAHVLRYWEQEFKTLKPVKRQGRRYYQHKDIYLLRRIRSLLYEEGFTIQGARQQLKKETPSKQTRAKTVVDPILPSVIQELEEILSELV